MDLGTTTSSISGMTFHHNATTSGSATVLLVRGQNVRIFNNNFVGVLTKVRALTITGTGSTIPHPTGVAWHNRFTDARAADCEGDLVTPYGGCRIWANADTFAALGNGNNWFTEDCRVQKTVNVGQNMFDMAYGGHVVIRYNLLIDHSIYGHGYDSTGTHERSTLSMEVYGNTIQQVTLSQGDPPVWYNGGYGVVWNNTVTGTWNLNRIQLDYPDVTGKGPGDYPLQDQPGRGIDASLWDGHTLPAPAQALTPLYEWNNTLNGGTLDFVVKTGRETWIVSGRDFYNNTVMPGYTPYPYPHPLRGYRFPGRKGKAATIYH